MRMSKNIKILLVIVIQNQINRDLVKQFISAAKETTAN